MGEFFNFRPGGAGRRTYHGTVILVDGTIDEPTGLSNIDHVTFSEVASSPSGENYSYEVSDGTITFNSSSGSDTATLTYFAYGY
jgi:hypothetical protein